MIKIIKFSFVTLVFIFSSCNIDDRNEILEDNKSVLEYNPYVLEKIITLSDEEFTVKYAIRANTQEEIDEILSLKPYIKVTKIDNHHKINSTNKEISTSIFMGTNEKEEVTSESSATETILLSNIPKGYSVSIFYANIGDLSSRSSARASYRDRSVSDTEATGIIVSLNQHQVPVHFYGKSPYVWWWRHRGYRTMGAHHTQYHYFNAMKYSSRTGAKVKAYTTSYAWNDMVISFVH